MRRSTAAVVLFLLGGCNCSDPALRASADAASTDASPIVDATAHDAREPGVDDDRGAPRDATIDDGDGGATDADAAHRGDAYLPRDPPPIPGEHACTGATSMRRLFESPDRSAGRSTVELVRWGDGLIVTWSETASLTAPWYVYAGRLDEPVAGSLDVGLSWVDDDAHTFVSTAGGDLRIVYPSAYAQVGPDGPGPSIELPPRADALGDAYPLGSCRGADAVLMTFGDGNTFAPLRWVDGTPRWYELVERTGTGGFRLCVAVGDMLVVARSIVGGFAVTRWDASGAVLASEWTVDIDGDSEGDVVVEPDGSATLVTATSSAGDPRFGVYALREDGVERVAETTVPAFSPFLHLLGIGHIGSRIGIVYDDMYLTTLDFDPETATFGAAALVADHPCWPRTNTVTLRSGVYAAMECYFEEIWLLRMCGATP